MIPRNVSSNSIYNDPVFLENMRRLARSRLRIIGGMPTSDFPDCVAVGNDEKFYCSGTLIGPNVVLSAGHCADAATRVFLGDNTSRPGASVDVRVAIVHPEYDPEKNRHDLLILILDRNVTSNPAPKHRLHHGRGCGVVCHPRRLR